MIARCMAAVVAFWLAGISTCFAADETAICPSQGKPPAPVKMTHFPPFYPTESVRAGEHGRTLLTITIGKDGIPADIRVASSSGSARLDEAASEIVRSKWRWYPFPPDCEASSGQIATVFGWFLDRPPKADFGLVVSSSQYPAGAAERYERGDTYLALTLDGEGTVTDGRIAYSSGYADLDEKALAMVKATPKIFVGKPVGSQTMMARWNLPSPQKDNVELLIISSIRLP